MKHYYNLKKIFLLCLGLGVTAAWGQIAVYDYTGGFVTYTVPAGVTSINIEALGAQGASGQTGYVGGKGAKMSGDFDVIPGTQLLIAVGGKGQGQNSGSNGGGGGGSFVVQVDPAGAYTMTVAAGPFASGTKVTPLVVAGGGGGTRASVTQNGNPGVTGLQGTTGSGSGAVGGGVPATAPEAGGIVSGSSWGSGGGGFVGNGFNDGSSGCGGKSFVNGAQGGTGCGSSGDNAAGGFGAGGQGRGSWGGGGGGGWSGGQGGRVAGGAGSYNIGMLQDNVTGFRDGDGQVTIEVLCLGLTPDIPVTGVCIGETLTLSAVSETGGTITWSGGVTDGVPFAPPLGTTVYEAYSTSPSDCNFTIEISASEIPDIAANSSLPTACEGAIITVWGTGGDTYTWTGSGGFDPTDSVGFIAEEGTVTYTVIGSILGCEGPADEVTLVGAPQPNVSGIADPAELCLGDSYTLTGAGALAVGFYWGGGITDGGTLTPASAGTFVHTVVGVSDVGCTDTATVTVLVHELPIVHAGMDVAVCEGHDVTLNASGADGYVWTPAITDGVAFPALEGETTYTVVGTDANGCTDDDAVVVTGVSTPVISSAVVTDEYFGYDGSIDITVTGGSGSYIYLWSHGPITEDVYSLTSGIYTVTIDDITIEKGMCSYEETFVLTSFVGVDENSISTLNAYPNPTTDLVTVVFEGQFNYQVLNLIGEVVANGSANGQTTLSMADLANGTYVIKVMAGDEVNFVHVVKQ